VSKGLRPRAGRKRGESDKNIRYGQPRPGKVRENADGGEEGALVFSLPLTMGGRVKN